MLESINKDARFKKHASTYVQKEVDSLKSNTSFNNISTKTDHDR